MKTKEPETVVKIVISDPALFFAASLFVGREEDRRYFHGIYVQPAEGGGILLTATDGKALFRAFDPEGTTPAPLTVSVGSKLSAAWAKAGSVWIDTDAGIARHSVVGPVRIAAIDVVFPDAVIGVIPREFSGAIAQFNPVDHARLASAAKAIMRTKWGGPPVVRMTHNGFGPALATFPGRDDCFGIVMPMRGVDAPEDMPVLPRAAA